MMQWARLGGIACALALMQCGGEGLKIVVDVPSIATADGKTAAHIAAKFFYNSAPLDRGTVQFQATLGKFTPISSTTPDTTGDSFTPTMTGSEASADLYSNAAGNSRVTVIWTDTLHSGNTGTQTADVVFGSGAGPQVGSIDFISADPDTIQLKGSGVETSRVTFKCKDRQGQPMPDGVTVNFAVVPDLGGATISPSTAKTSGGGGIVFTTLQAGTAVGSIKVTASSGTVSGESVPITIAGAPANFKNFTFGCESYVMAGFEWSNLTQKCLSIVADRNTQAIPNVQVTFITEAGVVQRQVTTDALGKAESIFTTANPLPLDVDPDNALFGALQCLDCLFRWTPPQPEPFVAGVLKNPRDGVVTVIAATSGEEEWTDVNANGKYDSGEPYIDLPEPFVDKNDSGERDQGEEIMDIDNDGQWDRPNGKWDARTTIWRQWKMIWSGGPVGGAGYSQILEGTPPNLTPASIGNIPHCGSKKLYFRFVDARLNHVASSSPSDSLSVAATGNAATDWSSLSLGSQDVVGRVNGIGFAYYSITVSDSHSCASAVDPQPSSVVITLSHTPTPSGTQASDSMQVTGTIP